MKINRPVISVGNITVGGSGKTPCCVYLLNLIIAKQKFPALVSRGYGNDESKLYQNNFPELKMKFQSDRATACQTLLNSNPNIDCFLLDDAYQHQKIERDLNILLINAREPFGFGYYLPRGYLRESIHNINRADLILITHTSSITDDNLQFLINTCQSNTKANTPILTSNHEPESFISPNNESIPIKNFLNIIKEKSIGIFSGIANPTSFQETVQKFSTITECINYGDHHQYIQEDFQNIRTYSERINYWITTEKDGVKLPKPLRKELNIYILKMKLNIIDKEDIIGQKLDELLT